MTPDDLWATWNTPMRRSVYLRRYGAEWEDRMHDGYLALLTAVAEGVIEKDIDRYITGILRVQFAKYCTIRTEERAKLISGEYMPVADSAPSPEQLAISAEIATQHRALADKASRNLPPKYQEILIRFYMQGQSREEVMRDMGLTYNQFRLAKTRAKERFTAAGRAICRPRGSAR